MEQRVLLIFVDGLGVASKNPATNPLARLPRGRLSVFSDSGGAERLPAECLPALPGGGVPLGLDARLGVEGIPQSATGQTTLLTGINAAQALGYHLFAFPNQRLRDLIREHSLLKRAVERGRRAAFINAYRPVFFELGAAVWEKPLSVTTWANKAAGLPFFTLADVAARRAIYQELTNAELRAKGFDVPLFSPEEAGAILGRRSADFDFLLYEYFRTDAVGHSRDMEKAVRELAALERFVGAVLQHVDLDATLVILTSDHGNIEDLSVQSHTLNPALTVLWGRDAAGAASRLRSIQDVAGAVLDRL